MAHPHYECFTTYTLSGHHQCLDIKRGNVFCTWIFFFFFLTRLTLFLVAALNMFVARVYSSIGDVGEYALQASPTWRGMSGDTKEGGPIRYEGMKNRISFFAMK